MLYVFKGIHHYSVGSEIILKDDSTFRYTTCANFITGTWTMSNDSLFLKILTNRWRIDSLNEYGSNGAWPKVPDKPMIFQYSNDQLFAIGKLKDGSKFLHRMKFVQDF